MTDSPDQTIAVRQWWTDGDHVTIYLTRDVAEEDRAQVHASVLAFSRTLVGDKPEDQPI